jgi:hypothetical protein
MLPACGVGWQPLPDIDGGCGLQTFGGAIGIGMKIGGVGSDTRGGLPAGECGGGPRPPVCVPGFV